MDDFDVSLSADQPAGPPQRVVCVDESCTGTMGSDGRCRVCGTLIHTGDIPNTDASAEPGQMAAAAEPDESQSPADELTEAEALPEDEWRNRRLCPDESCIGTLGRDDRCRVCGRLASDN
jgi:hypothetical protein